jgi:hypothetical protein
MRRRLENTRRVSRSATTRTRPGEDAGRASTARLRRTIDADPRAAPNGTERVRPPKRAEVVGARDRRKAARKIGPTQRKVVESVQRRCMESSGLPELHRHLPTGGRTAHYRALTRAPARRRCCVDFDAWRATADRGRCPFRWCGRVPRTRPRRDGGCERRVPVRSGLGGCSA